MVNYRETTRGQNIKQFSKWANATPTDPPEDVATPESRRQEVDAELKVIRGLLASGVAKVHVDFADDELAQCVLAELTEEERQRVVRGTPVL